MCLEIVFVQMGRTALHVAAEKGHQACVALLVDYKADVEVVDNVGFYAL